jgi:hypothetical protein
VGAHSNIPVVCVCVTVCVCAALQIIVLYCTTAVYSATGNACPREIQNGCNRRAYRHPPKAWPCSHSASGYQIGTSRPILHAQFTRHGLREGTHAVPLCARCYGEGASSLPVHTAGSSVRSRYIVAERRVRGRCRKGNSASMYFEVGVEGRRTRYEEQCSSAERGTFSRLSTGKKQRNCEDQSRRR